MTKVSSTFPVKRWLDVFNKENGQTLMEYALIISLIAIIAIVAMTFFGNRLLALFTILTSQAF